MAHRSNMPDGCNEVDYERYAGLDQPGTAMQPLTIELNQYKREANSRLLAMHTFPTRDEAQCYANRMQWSYDVNCTHSSNADGYTVFVNYR